jgi:hypothetical protein
MGRISFLLFGGAGIMAELIRLLVAASPLPK